MADTRPTTAKPTSAKPRTSKAKARAQRPARTPARAPRKPEPAGTGPRAYAVQAAETAVDVPVGTALTFVDRINDVVDPFRTRSTAEAELRRVRGQLTRRLNGVERRGGTARRRAVRRARQTRGRLERAVTQRRRRLETRVRQSRRRAATSLSRNRSLAETRAREALDRVGAMV